MKSLKILAPLFLLPILLVAQSKQNSTRPLVLAHVTVIDATGAAASSDMTVVIAGGHITALGKSEKTKVPKDAAVVDATGKFLIPGLWDMHAHLTYKEFLALFVANGVTGVREMGGDPNEFEHLKQWRKQIEERSLLGPRIVTAGVIVDGPKEIGRRSSLNVANAIEGREAVDYLKQHGAEFVKVYSMLPREAYFAIADEAKKQGLPFAGHVPASVSAAEASDAGQRSIEHFFGVLTACSTNEAEVWNEAAATISKSGIAVFVGAEIRAELKALDTYGERTAATLFARFVRNGTWQVPTLVGWRTLSLPDNSSLANDPRLKYIPRERKEAWKKQLAGLPKSFPAEYAANKQRLFQRQLELLLEMHRAGVQILAGTDTAGLYEYPGFSLHDELGLFVKAGLTPMEALQAATRDPARYFGRLDSLGTVEKGKIADLVLLEANPLEDISNTKKIAAVVLGGKLLLKSKLEEMLAAVEAAASKE